MFINQYGFLIKKMAFETIKKILKRHTYLTVFGIAALASQACGSFGTPEEAVEGISTPSDAQQFILDNISYAHEDTDGGKTDRLPRALNGANTQSFRETFERGRGVCRDGAVAIASLLQDDNYPSLYLSVTSSDFNHGIFVYQEDGKWGSAGINSSDFRKPKFDTLEELVGAVEQQFDSDSTMFTLYDLSLIDLLEGSNDGLVSTKTCLIESRGSITAEGGCEKIPEGYQSFNTTYDGIKTIIRDTTYTSDLFSDQTMVETWRGDDLFSTKEWHVVERTPHRIPEETIETFISGGINREIHSWLTYNDDLQISAEIKEIRNSGQLTLYEERFMEYNAEGNLIAEEIHSSTDGDLDIDIITKYIYHSDGTRTFLIDSDLDGNWD